MTTPSKACVFGLFGGCVADGFVQYLRFDVSIIMDSSLSNPSVRPRKAKSKYRHRLAGGMLQAENASDNEP
jgi:hypothetical protein